MTDKRLAQKIGASLRAGRKCRGMKQKELAEILGVSPTFICEIEYGHKTPSIFMLHKLERELNWIIWPQRKLTSTCGDYDRQDA